MIRALAMVAVVAACGRSADAPPPTTPGADPFWSYVAAHATALQAEPLEAAMAELQRELSPAHPGVLVEIGADGAHRTLVLTGDGDRALFPAIQAMYANRPQIAGWDIVAFRQREASRPLAVIAMGDRRLDPQAVHYVAERTGGKLDVIVFVPGYTAHDTRLAQMTYIALDHAVGEYDVETRIGAISLVAGDKAPASSAALGDLPHELDSALGSATP
jgi:hypothetical protein